MCWRSTSIFVSPGRACRCRLPVATWPRPKPTEPRKQVVELGKLHPGPCLLAIGHATRRCPGINAVRSITFTPSRSSRERSCPGESSWSKITASARVRVDHVVKLAELSPCRRTWPDPAPSGSARSGRRARRPPNRPARRASSRSSSAIPRPTPTRTARSRTRGRHVADSGDSSTSARRCGSGRDRPRPSSSAPAGRTRGARRSGSVSTRSRRRGTDDQAARQSVAPRRELLGREPGITTARGGTVPRCSTGRTR
jgi:hypothetical protein